MGEGCHGTCIVVRMFGREIRHRNSVIHMAGCRYFAQLWTLLSNTSFVGMQPDGCNHVDQSCKRKVSFISV